MTYTTLREQYKPTHIKLLFIAESPPPAADVQSSRHFYRSEKIRRDDRLFTNTIKALFPEAAALTEGQIQPNKEAWLKKFQSAGYYMIEALEESQVHEVTKLQRQEKIKAVLPHLIKRVKALVEPGTRIILIKSNVFDVAAQPLRSAGFKVLNTGLVDYPGRFNQHAYREKITALIHG
ncbi:MAG TPA: hypothetical protein VFT87_05075 [Candidatus Saccharimonadales bacterium]|nr:hypothetical protein [Candidatus Saccharimonadales bacterium]